MERPSPAAYRCFPLVIFLLSFLTTPPCDYVQLETRVETLVETRDAQDEEVARLAGRLAVLESELAQSPNPPPAAAQPPAMPGPGAACHLLLRVSGFCGKTFARVQLLSRIELLSRLKRFSACCLPHVAMLREHCKLAFTAALPDIHVCCIP